MKPFFKIGILVIAGALTCAGANATEVSWQTTFKVSRAQLGAGPGNAYFPLVPKQTLVYKNAKETDTVTVLNRTMLIDGVQTRVVEDRVVRFGQLEEVTRDYYADDRVKHDVYYFGEDVDDYRNGKIVSHAGSWRSGTGGAHFGLIMPALPRRGMRFHQERAPGVGMDRAEIISTDGTARTGAGTFRACVVMRESDPLKPGAVEFKYYAPNVGVVKDADTLLVRMTK